MSLPEGWVETTLGEVIPDYAKNKKVSSNELSDDTWVLELEDIEKHSSKLLKKVTYSERQSKSTKNIFDKGDVLYGKLRPYLNKVIIAEDNGVCTTEIIPIKENEKVISKYIFYVLKSSAFLKYVEFSTHGLNMPRLGTTSAKKAPFPLPPLKEQKQIVQKLEQVLARVERIKMALDNAPATIKHFRQSVLALAVSGELTEEWRKENLGVPKINIKDIEDAWIVKYEKDGKKYRKVILEASTIERDLPKTWNETQLGYIFDIYVGSTPSRKYEEYWNGDIPWISSGEVAFTQIKDTKEKITAEGLKNTSTNVHPIGTVLLAMIGQGKTRGQPAILEIEACHNQNTAGLRVHPNFTESKYLYYYLWERYEKTREIGGGNNQKALNKKTVQNLPFPLPPLEEQKAIVKKVETLFTLADNLEVKVNKAQKWVDRLTQSILAKAFRGELEGSLVS